MVSDRIFTLLATLYALSIGQGQQLSQIFRAHGIPVNSESRNGIVTVESMPAKIEKDNLTLHIVGPTEENLAELRKEWLKWIEHKKKKQKTENIFLKPCRTKKLYKYK